MAPSLIAAVPCATMFLSLSYRHSYHSQHARVGLVSQNGRFCSPPSSLSSSCRPTKGTAVIVGRSYTLTLIIYLSLLIVTSYYQFTRKDVSEPNCTRCCREALYSYLCGHTIFRTGCNWAEESQTGPHNNQSSKFHPTKRMKLSMCKKIPSNK